MDKLTSTKSEVFVLGKTLTEDEKASPGLGHHMGTAASDKNVISRLHEELSKLSERTRKQFN